MTTTEILAKFHRLQALVVGDICLDRWCRYDPALAEASRETGIPRIAVTAVENTPGAGGTVANNMAALGAGRVSVLGLIGNDGNGWELRNALAARGIDSALLVASPAMQTFTYTKLLNSRNNDEDQPRVDFVNAQDPPPEAEAAILARIREHAPRFDVVMVSDQAETEAGGVVTAAVRDAIAGLALAHPGKVFWVDSRLRCERFRHVIVKPNEREAREACERAFGRIDFPALRAMIGSRPMVVTRGDKGVEIWDGQGVQPVAGRGVTPVDICGAGDSFSAGCSLALAASGSMADAARIGNLVASITSQKKGTGTASADEVRAAERGGA
ncbi:MAG: PfkB family carbohydrate kinase [Bryobacteraceae bacterium]